MKHIILAAAVFASTAFSATALDEEFMIVKLKDGSTIEYNVLNIENVSFEQRHTDEAFTVTPANGDSYAGYLTIPTMFRAKPANTGDATTFGFGTVEATAPADLIAGEYGVQIAVSAAKIYQGEIDLAIDKDSYTIKLMKYKDGGSEYILENIASGTLNTRLNSKNQKVTIELDAVFEDGTKVTASYTDKPTDVESLKAIVAPVKYGNEVFYHDLNGNVANAKIASVTKKYSSFSQKTTLTFTLQEGQYIGGSSSLTVKLTDAIMNSEKTEFNLAQDAGWEFAVDGTSLQLISPTGETDRDYYSHVIDNGLMRFVKNGNGTYQLYFEFKNSYITMGNAGSTLEKIIFNYEGAFE